MLCFGCNNDSCYPEKLVVKSHGTQLKYHYFPKNRAKRAKLVTHISTLNVGNQHFCMTFQQCKYLIEITPNGVYFTQLWWESQ